MTNPHAVEAQRGNPADIYSKPWTRHGSGEDEWWSINGYTAKRDWRRTWVVRYRGVAVAEDNDLQQAMATALLNNSADGNAQPAPQPEAQASPAPAPLSELQIADLFTARTGLDPEESRERFIWYRRGVRHVVEHLGGIGLDGGM